MLDRQESINVLGFNPFTKTYGVWTGPNGETLYELTPRRASYILDNHNADNRRFSSGQQQKLSKSIDLNGWQKDGDPLRFNTQGNIPEYQHRLEEVKKRNVTIYVPLVLGVTPESCTKTAGAITRGPWSEISRIDKEAVKEEATVLGIVVKYIAKGSGKGYEPKELTLQNASSLWPEWQDRVRKGIQLSKPFFDKVTRFNKDTRTLNAWATLMCQQGFEKEAKLFLNLLKDQTLEKSSVKLTKDFLRLYCDDEVSFLSNEQRPPYVFRLLCAASDVLINDNSGETDALSKYNFVSLGHDTMKMKGVYREFLVDPDGNYGNPTLDNYLKDD